MTVRDLIKQMQKEIRETDDLQVDRAADLLTKLAALLGNCNDEIRMADMAYAAVLLHHLESSQVASRARIRAQTTPEYARSRAARDTKELAIELMRALKYFLKAKEDELRNARFQHA